MTSTSPPIVIPSGYHPPFAVVTDTDHTAWIIIAAALGLSMILLFSAIKIFIRWSISPRVGLDEAFLAAATVCVPLAAGCLFLYFPSFTSCAAFSFPMRVYN